MQSLWKVDDILDSKKINDGLIEKIWLTPISILYVFIILSTTSLIAINNFMPKQGVPSAYQVVVILSIFASSVFMLLLYVFFTIRNSTFPKIKDGKIGIFILIHAENIKRYNEIKYQFSNAFSPCIIEFDLFSIAYIPFLLTKKKYSREFIDKKLKKANALYYIEITINTDNSEQVELYEIKINQGIRKTNLEEEVSQKLESEIEIITEEIKSIKFSRKEKIDTLNITAEYLTLICNYIIGVTFYLNGKSTHNVAKEIHEKLYDKVFSIRKNDRTIRELKKLLPYKCYCIFIIEAQEKYNGFIFGKEGCLDNIFFLLEKANKYYPNTYSYYMLKANCHVLAKDNTQARTCIAMCKNISKTEKSWLYSDAYLTAYDTEKFLTIYNKYEKAFRIPYPIIQLINYIETILEEEPEKTSLLFALGLLYHKSGDIINTRVVFREFYQNYPYNTLDERINKIIQTRTELTFYDLIQIEITSDGY